MCGVLQHAKGVGGVDAHYVGDVVEAVALLVVLAVAAATGAAAVPDAIQPQQQLLADVCCELICSAV